MVSWKFITELIGSDLEAGSIQKTEDIVVEVHHLRIGAVNEADRRMRGDKEVHALLTTGNDVLDQELDDGARNLTRSRLPAGEERRTRALSRHCRAK